MSRTRTNEVLFFWLINCWNLCCDRYRLPRCLMRFRFKIVGLVWRIGLKICLGFKICSRSYYDCSDSEYGEQRERDDFRVCKHVAKIFYLRVSPVVRLRRMATNYMVYTSTILLYYTLCTVRQLIIKMNANQRRKTEEEDTLSHICKIKLPLSFGILPATVRLFQDYCGGITTYKMILRISILLLIRAERLIRLKQRIFQEGAINKR